MKKERPKAPETEEEMLIAQIARVSRMRPFVKDAADRFKESLEAEKEPKL